jgi:hypothetical protein
VSLLAPEPAAAPDAAVVGLVSLELLHAAASNSASTAPTSSERRKWTWDRL